jgi:hypothetical protein
MRFLLLLWKELKDDAVIEILEGLGMEVIYEPDRLHEGRPDIYWAAAKPAGIQFRFNAAQQLDVIFLHIKPGGGYAAVSQHDCDITFFSSGQETEAFGNAQNLQVAKGRSDFLGVSREWVRLGFAAHSIHYEFQAESLALVTISRTD